MKREFTKRKSVIDGLKKFTFTQSEDAYIEVTEWTSGEGYDITIWDDSETKNIHISYCELEAIKHLVSVLEHDFKEEEQ